jgi:hypothetical protein
MCYLRCKGHLVHDSSNALRVLDIAISKSKDPIESADALLHSSMCYLRCKGHLVHDSSTKNPRAGKIVPTPIVIARLGACDSPKKSLAASRLVTRSRVMSRVLLEQLTILWFSVEVAACQRITTNEFQHDAYRGTLSKSVYKSCHGSRFGRPIFNRFVGRVLRSKPPKHLTSELL